MKPSDHKQPIKVQSCQHCAHPRGPFFKNNTWCCIRAERDFYKNSWFKALSLAEHFQDSIHSSLCASLIDIGGKRVCAKKIFWDEVILEVKDVLKEDLKKRGSGSDRLKELQDNQPSQS